MPPEVFMGDNEFIFLVCLDVLFDVGSDGRKIAIGPVKMAWGEKALRVGILGCGFCVCGQSQQLQTKVSLCGMPDNFITGRQPGLEMGSSASR